MNEMRIIAKHGAWEVTQDYNGNIILENDTGTFIYDYSNAYEAIRREVKDPAIRAELIAQWKADMAKQDHAEKNSKEAEFRG